MVKEDGLFHISKIPAAMYTCELIHSADLSQTCCPSVRTLQNLAKQNNFRVEKGIATSATMGLAKWIIDDTCLV